MLKNFAGSQAPVVLSTKPLNYEKNGNRSDIEDGRAGFLMWLVCTLLSLTVMNDRPVCQVDSVQTNSKVHCILLS